MNQKWKKVLVVLILLTLLLVGLLLTIGQWLPRLAGIWLPAGTTISLEGGLRWHDRRLELPDVHYQAGQCELASVHGISLRYHEKYWLADAKSVVIDSECLSSLPDSDNQSAPRTLAEWQQMLPGASIRLHQLTIKPWPQWAGELRLNFTSERQHLRYLGENLSLDAELQQQKLTVRNLTMQVPEIIQPVTVSGDLTLASVPEEIPTGGALHGNFTLDGVPEALDVELNWQQQDGLLRLTTADHSQSLLELPWQISPQSIQIQQGKWNWPWGSQPLSGGVSLLAKNWQQGLTETEFSGRLNVLTQGMGGKGNVVLTFGPGKVDWQNSQLPVRLTGESKLSELQFYASLPGELRGALTDPQLHFLPGSLLRMKGRLLSTLEVDEARWPLAGVSVSTAGISGRLQAILSAHDQQMGDFRLHLDGNAENFWPDNGEWRWRYWGDGHLTPLGANWDVKGEGSWQDQLIELTSLSTGFNQLSYGSVKMGAPRLTLKQPIRWQRDAENPSFSGALQLKAQKTQFSSGGYLPPSILNFNIDGTTPDAFLYKGTLQAEHIGPVQLNGRWDGERLRGQAWWPEQSLQVFQPLISPNLKMLIQDGTLKAQVAFSATSDQGLVAGGHWLVRQGEVRMPDNDIRGIDFSLPFRLQNHRWYFGTQGPVALRIAEISNQFSMQNITADLRGWYPWSNTQPLTLSDVSVDVLGGVLSMEKLQMPQREAAKIRLNNLSLSRLITALKLKQIALSGKVNGELPLWLNNSQWLVKGGWVANNGPLTVRLDKDMADAISKNNIAAGAATDWLRYMEISRSWATLDLDNLGEMQLKAKVNGTSRFSDQDQRVSLNYTQQENVFQLWRSLRFGDNLQSWVEEHATLPSQKEKRDESRH